MNLLKKGLLALLAGAITMNIQAASAPDASHTSGAALTAGATPIFNTFELGIQPGKTADYDRVGEHNITTSVGHEPGTLAIYAATAQDNPNLWYFFEVYADEAACQAHRQSPHFQDYLKRTGELLQDKSFTDISPTLLMNKGGLAFSAP